MPSIDDKVVAASFETAKFEAGIAQTLAGLAKLNEALTNIGKVNGLQGIETAANKITLDHPLSAIDKLKAKLGFGKEAAEGLGEIDKAAGKVSLDAPLTAIDKLKSKLGFGKEAADGFGEIEKASSKVSLEGLTRALDNVTNKFSVLEGAASVALGNITSQAAMRGAAFAKSFALGPITDGFKEYSTNLNSIQTILANTADSGGNLKSVNAALQELNTYSDKTIYNFSEMARNIGTFTAAGVQLKPATAAIKGIANLAALSGSNSQQASTAMYQLSQAIAAGKVGLQDWNSVVNAGMGGAVFQKALLRTADNMGAIEKGAFKIDKATGKATVNGQSFRESITAKPGEKSWLTSDVLTKTLSQFTGDLSNADLAAQGFNKSQIKAIQAQAKTAQLAATEVKTLPQVFDVARETIGSGWSATFQTIFGNFGESKKTFTALSNTINGFINTNANARNKVLADWKELGGRTALINGIKFAFKDLLLIIQPIKDAFRDIFPAKNGLQLANLTRNFEVFFKLLRPSPATIMNLEATFRGLFALLDIGKMIISGVFSVIGQLFSAVGKGSGSFLDFTGNLGDSILGLRNWLKEGDRLKNFFTVLGGILAAPIRMLGQFKDVIVGLFDGINSKDGSTLKSIFDSLKTSLGPAVAVLHVADAAFQAFLGVVEQLGQRFKPAIDNISTAFNGFAQMIADSFKNMNFDTVFQVIQTSLIGGIFLAIKKALGGGFNINIGANVLKSLSGAFDVLTGSLKTMQTNVKANTLLQIAAAMAILSVSIVALSRVNSANLSKSMTAIAVGFGELVGSMTLLTKGVGAASFAKLPFIAGSLILLATAMNILAVAVKILSTLSWESLAKGLGGIGALLLGLSLAIKPLSAGSVQLPIIGVGLIAVGVALNILAGAVKIFGSMDFKTLGKGLLGMAIALEAIGFSVAAMPPSIILIGPGLIAVGVALGIISGAVLAFGSMDLKTLGKGILGVGAALIVIGAAAALMIPIIPALILLGPGLILVGLGLSSLGAAIGLLGNMDVSTLAKGIIAIGAALVVLAAGLTLMIVALPGAAALLVAAAALAILVPVIGILGTMSWGTIGKGLAAIGAALLIIGGAGAVAAPFLAILGIGLAALGVGLLAVGAGVYLLAKGISILARDGTKGVAVIIAAITGLIAIAPKIAIDFAKGLIGIVQAVANLAPLVVDALAKILNSLVDVIIKDAPKIGQAFTALIQAGLLVLINNVPSMVTTGFTLLTALLTGISSHISDVTKTVSDIAIKFLTGFTAKLPELTRAGVNALAALLQGIANNISKVTTAAGNLVAKLVSGIIAQYGKVLKAGVDALAKFISGIGSNINALLSAGVNLVAHIISGIASKAGDLVAKGVAIAGQFIRSVANAMLKLTSEGAKAIIAFLNGIADAINRYEPQIVQAGIRIGAAVVTGFLQGLAGSDIVSAVVRKFQGAVDAAKRVLKSKSPSQVFHEIGGYVVEGFANGLSKNNDAIVAMESMANGLINSVKSIFQISSPSKVMAEIGKYVGEGFLAGLTGTTDDMTEAFTTLNDKLTTAMASIRETIATEEDKLDKLRAAKKHDNKAIKDAQDAIAKNNKLLDEASATHTLLLKNLTKEKAELADLAKQYQDVSDNLDKAVTALEDAKKTRDDALTGFQNKYGELPELTPDAPNQLLTYEQSIQNQVAAVAAYQSTLEQLRALGLDDATYQKLLNEGTADQQFATQLLAGGKTAVAGLNALDAQLAAVSKTLATQAATNLYQAGVDAAQGLVDGLKSSQSTIAKQMEDLATIMIKAIKKKLKIKSPSQEFYAVGDYMMKGLDQGIQNGSKLVSSTLSTKTDDMIKGMLDSVSKVPGVLDGLLDFDPVITPVLDLTQVKSGAKKLGALVDVASISTGTSLGQANLISSDSTRQADAASTTSSVMEFKFEQTNISPEPLSAIEIYRRTSNQLSQVKTALAL